MKRALKLLTVIVAASAVPTAVALAASSPSVTTGSASSISPASAILNGTVNPNGNTAHFSFELGLTKSYGVTIASKQAIGGSVPVAVKATASHLLPGTTYHFRLDATNGAGSAVGADRTFHTAGNPPPAAATGPANGVGTTVATVTGVIDAHNQTTTYVFQYGISTHYNVETLPHTVPAGNKPVTVSEQLTGLGPGTLYHYRLVALHGSTVIQDGADAVFFTKPLKPPPSHVYVGLKPHRARSAPFVFKLSGSLIGSTSIPRFAACSGNAVVLFRLRHRLVGSTIVSIQPNCSFSGEAIFSRLPRHKRRHHKLRLRVIAHFPGNGYLAPSDSKVKRVTLG